MIERPYIPNPTLGGKVRATYAQRGENGRFLPAPREPDGRPKVVSRAARLVRSAIVRRAMSKVQAAEEALGAMPAFEVMTNGVDTVAAPVADMPIPAAEEAEAGEAVDLLDDLLLALLDLPDWDKLAAELPEELYDRIDHYLEAQLA